jgi:hypothetical protein
LAQGASGGRWRQRLAARGIRTLERFVLGAHSTMRATDANLLIPVGNKIVGGAG